MYVMSTYNYMGREDKEGDGIPDAGDDNAVRSTQEMTQDCVAHAGELHILF